MTSTRIEDLSTESGATDLSDGPVARQRLPRLNAGTKLHEGRFEIRGQLGAGGMGVVYEAYDWATERRVALKTGHLLHPETIYRLKGEFRALRDVVHPNLVQLHGLFAENELWYFTMELVEGADLGAWFTSAARTEAELRAAFAQLANGVHAIHLAGKVHRDLKPSNVLISPTGRLVILDFGLVSDAVPGGVGQTQVDGRISGTPAYLSPEQVYGGPASRAGDWYAFGVMLYQALTGELPCSKTHPWTYVGDGHQGAESLRRANVAADLAHLCLRLLATEPNERPEFAEVLSTLGGSLVAAREASRYRSNAADPTHTCGALDRALLATRRGAMHVLTFATPPERQSVVARLCELDENGGALVLRGTYRRDEVIPFNGLDSIVDELSHHLAKLPRERAAALMPRDVGELAQLFPVLNRVEVVAEFPARLIDPGDAQRRSRAALCELLARLCDRQPVVIVLEGLEYADDATLGLLEALLAGEPLPVLVVLLSSPASPRLSKLLRAVQTCPWAQLHPSRKAPNRTSSAGEELRHFRAQSSAA